MSNDEDKREPHDIGRIAYEAAAVATGCTQPWEQADQAKWTSAARGVLAWACDQMEQEAEYGCPCTEDERLTWENADLLRELGGLPRRDTETPNGPHEGRPTRNVTGAPKVDKPQTAKRMYIGQSRSNVGLGADAPERN